MAFEFTVDSFRDFSQQIIDAKGDQATLTTLLADMQGTFTDNIGLLAKNQKELDESKAERDRLLQANMSLYLRIGEHEKADPGSGSPTEPEQPIGVDQYLENLLKEEK